MKRNGFTLMELILILAIIMVIVGVALPLFMNKSDYCDIESSMNNYMKNLHEGIVKVKVQCSNRDSDHDGYYRCTATGFEPFNLEERKIFVAECDCTSCAPIVGIDK